MRWVFVGVLVSLSAACSGTESGNPINPVRPPGFEAQDDVDDFGMNGPDPDMMVGDDFPPPNVIDMPPENGDDASPDPIDAPPGAVPPDDPGDLSPSAGGQMGEAPAPGDASTDGGCEPTQCEQYAQAAAQRLAMVQAAPQAYASPQCSELDGQWGCQCDAATRVASGAGCISVDRFGACLYAADEFSGCTSNGGECQAVCDEVFARQATAAAQAYEVSVVDSACVQDVCRYVLMSGAQCYVAEPPQPLECSAAGQVLSP